MEDIFLLIIILYKRQFVAQQINHGIAFQEILKENVLLPHTKNVDIVNCKVVLVHMKSQFYVQLTKLTNVYKINNNVIVQIISLNVQLIINAFLKICLIYVNQLILINVVIHYSQYYVKMDNVDNQEMTVQLKLFVHLNTLYVLI